MQIVHIKIYVQISNMLCYIIKVNWSVTLCIFICLVLFFLLDLPRYKMVLYIHKILLLWQICVMLVVWYLLYDYIHIQENYHYNNNSYYVNIIFVSQFYNQLVTIITLCANKSNLVYSTHTFSVITSVNCNFCAINNYIK